MYVSSSYLCVLVLGSGQIMVLIFSVFLERSLAVAMWMTRSGWRAGGDILFLFKVWYL